MNITLDHNCALGIVVTWKSKKTGEPFDTAGCTATWQIRREPGGPLLGEFTVTFPEPSESGQIRGHISAAAVNAIPDGTYRHDLLITDATGNPRKGPRGSCKKQGTISEPT